MTELRNGDLLAAWYGGSDETQSDVWMYSAVRSRRTGRWSMPYRIQNARSTGEAIGSNVKSVGNPVLINEGDRLTMFFVEIPFGGWSTATICMMTSADGVRWSQPRRLAVSPFFNTGVLAKGKPILYDDGTLALPIYYQLGRKQCGVVQVTRSGAVIDASRLEDPRPFLQPWIIPVSGERALAVLRWSSQVPGCINTAGVSNTLQWTPITGTALVHRDSAVAVERLTDGSLLLAYNNSAWNRRDLSLARSLDGGRTWSKPHPIERDTTPNDAVRREYSYPYFYRSSDGLLHVVYTWQRTRIKHLTFNEAWVRADPLLGARR